MKEGRKDGIRTTATTDAVPRPCSTLTYDVTLTTEHSQLPQCSPLCPRLAAPRSKQSMAALGATARRSKTLIEGERRRF